MVRVVTLFQFYISRWRKYDYLLISFRLFIQTVATINMKHSNNSKIYVKWLKVNYLVCPRMKLYFLGWLKLLQSNELLRFLIRHMCIIIISSHVVRVVTLSHEKMTKIWLSADFISLCLYRGRQPGARGPNLARRALRNGPWALPPKMIFFYFHVCLFLIIFFCRWKTKKGQIITFEFFLCPNL